MRRQIKDLVTPTQPGEIETQDASAPEGMEQHPATREYTLKYILLLTLLSVRPAAGAMTAEAAERDSNKIRSTPKTTSGKDRTINPVTWEW